MGRELTPQEREAYERIRRRNLEETASKLGISAEKLERIENDAARAGAEAPVHERVQAEAALRAALEKLAKNFTESLKTDTYREALENAGDIDSISDDDFSTLLAQRMSVLDEEERREAERSISRQIERCVDDPDAPFSLREEILLNLQGMIKSHNYRAGN